MPLTDETFTMAPPPPSTMTGAAARIPWNVPRMEASTTRS